MPLASSMVATASITASRSSVTVPPLVGDRLSRPAGRLIQSQYRAPVFMQLIPEGAGPVKTTRLVVFCLFASFLILAGASE